MPARVAHAVTHNDLTEHVGYIKSMVDRSIREGGGRKLALQIVNDVYDVEVDPRTGKEVRVVRAWGKTFLAPPGDVCRPKLDECEIDKIWDFMVLNCRYVFDPADIDTFATLKETLLSGGGDCDDAAIAFATLLGSIGFRVLGRVISTSKDPNAWVHIYPLVGVPKEDPKQWIPLDITVEGSTPGWEYEDIGQYVDYVLV